MKKMNFVTMVLGLVLASTAMAEDLVLGELTGAAAMNVSVVGTDGRTSSYVNNCKMAYNLSMDHSGLQLDFGVVTCDQGLDSWNENPVYLTVADSKVFDNGVQVGTVDANGVMNFEISRYQVKTYQVVHYDINCRADRFETKKFNVGSTTVFRVEKLAEKSFRVVRSERSLDAGTVIKKPWPNCPSAYDYAPTSKTLSFDVNLNK